MFISIPVLMAILIIAMFCLSTDTGDYGNDQ